MKNFFIRFIFKMVQKFIPKNQTSNRILIVSTTALGDTLWATAAIESLRKSLPNSFIAVLTSRIGKEILENNPYIDKLFVLKEPLSLHFFSLWKELYKEKFGWVLLFHSSQRLTLPLCSLLGADQMIGTSGINKGLDCFLTQALPNETQHEIVRRLKIIETVGAKITTEKLSFFLTDSNQNFHKKVPWIAFHPGSKDPFKRWPKEKFIELGNLLKEKMNCEIVITGTEEGLKEEIASQIPNAHIDKTAKLKDFAHFLKKWIFSYPMTQVPSIWPPP